MMFSGVQYGDTKQIFLEAEDKKLAVADCYEIDNWINQVTLPISNSSLLLPKNPQVFAKCTY